MTLLKLFLLGLLFSITQLVISQTKKQYKGHAIAFYNMENLFDTINDPNIFDESSPILKLKFHKSEVYKQKIKNMARVIADIGKDVTQNAPAIIGICEVENREVIEDVINDSLLRSKYYGIIHYNSPDARGIDVALLYQKPIFTPLATESKTLNIYDQSTGKRQYTRDQLIVSGLLEGEPFHIIVNHWPSQRGGQAKSEHKRMTAAKLTKQIIDSLQAIDPYAKICIMGDFNDDPTSASIKKVLKPRKDKYNLPLKAIYNPYNNLFKKGFGTTAYRDSWSLFDQIMLTQPLVTQDYSSFNFYKAAIYNKRYLIDQTGRFKGYPKRSFSNGSFTNGYSDHFPVFIILLKVID
ncbi:endonuclease/exonuclease/phosphatase family protein [Aestuariibaculum sediminum]|uniref:Endonuclease/exonuclease/phosphatase family protein n=1 Tax=Aestuariibaculum sediminum TaxID=2770637 RepID=A0A8J6Q1H0_9FLAO|nr:endonuclease/exonuclease/phosphatase family protein [Aestuariibaculum sediminum]MBD0831040.1 endonuclease/exonuclease/phosphatase family protein [Aestuariibaculum sediminum]